MVGKSSQKKYPNGGEFNGDESHGIESVKNHQLNKSKDVKKDAQTCAFKWIVQDTQLCFSLFHWFLSPPLDFSLPCKGRQGTIYPTALSGFESIHKIGDMGPNLLAMNVSQN